MLFALALYASALDRTVPTTGRHEPASLGSFKVMSFNIRRGDAEDGRNHWVHRRQAAARIIQGQNPDIIGLQEALPEQLAYLRETLDEYTIVGRGRERDGKGEHTALLFRRARFAVDTTATFWFSKTPEVAGSVHWGNRLPRTCTWARVTDRITGKTLLFLNVHLDHSSSRSRRASVDLLLRRARELAGDATVVVTGDFNAGEDHPCIRSMRGEASAVQSDPPDSGLPLFDTYRAVYPKRRFSATFHLFSGLSIGPRIDYIFAPSTLRVLDVRIVRTKVDGRYPSDHYPVVARLAPCDRIPRTVHGAPASAS